MASERRIKHHVLHLAVAHSTTRAKSDMAAPISKRARIPKSREGRPNVAHGFQPWVASDKWPEPRPPSRRSGALACREGGRGERRYGVGPTCSFVPDGTRFLFAPQPTDESLYLFTVGGAHAPRVLCSAPSPNTRSGRRGRRPVQPRRPRSPKLNTYESLGCSRASLLEADSRHAK